MVIDSVSLYFARSQSRRRKRKSSRHPQHHPNMVGYRKLCFQCHAYFHVTVKLLLADCHFKFDPLEGEPEKKSKGKDLKVGV